MRFYSVVDQTLLKRLTRGELEHVLRTKKYSLIFTINGLPEEPSRKELVDFMQTNSEFWRRQQTIQNSK